MCFQGPIFSQLVLMLIIYEKCSQFTSRITHIIRYVKIISMLLHLNRKRGRLCVASRK